MVGDDTVPILRRANIGDDGADESDPADTGLLLLLLLQLLLLLLLLVEGDTRKCGSLIWRLEKSEGDVADVNESLNRVKTGTLANCSEGIRILAQHLVQMVLRHSLQLCHHAPKTEKRVLRHTKHTFPLMTSSLMEESRGRFSREADVSTCLMCITSWRVTALP